MLAAWLTVLLILSPGVPACFVTSVAACCEEQGRGAEPIADLERRARSGDPEAQLRLAQAYEQGEGIAQNQQEAADWYRRVAEQGHPVGQDRLGEMYRAGDGVERDKVQAIAWYQKSARQGYASAMFHLGAAYFNGDGVSVDDGLSYAWFLLASQAGNAAAAEGVRRAEAQRKDWIITDGYKKIAQMYDAGDSLPANPAEAERWWLKAAERRDHDAEIALADKLLNGQGARQDANEARHWCSEAARDGDSRGAYCLGYIYQNGLGVKRGRRGGEKVLRARSDKSKRPGSQGARSHTGEGGKVDLVGACVLYAELAVKLGDNQALQTLEKLKQKLRASDWQKVEKRLALMRIDTAKLDSALQTAAAP
jgi:TPR repeat protein